MTFISRFPSNANPLVLSEKSLKFSGLDTKRAENFSNFSLIPSGFWMEIAKRNKLLRVSGIPLIRESIFPISVILFLMGSMRPAFI